APRPAGRPGARPANPRPDRRAPAPHRAGLRRLPRPGREGGRLARRRGPQDPGARKRPAGGDTPAGRLLRPLARPGQRRRGRLARSVLGRRQPRSRVQISGESMKAVPVAVPDVSAEPPVGRAFDLTALAGLFGLTWRQHLRGRRLLILSLLFL